MIIINNKGFLNVGPKFIAMHSIVVWDFSQVHKCQPYCGARGKVSWLLKPFGLMSHTNIHGLECPCVTIHDRKWTDITISSATLLTWLKVVASLAQMMIFVLRQPHSQFKKSIQSLTSFNWVLLETCVNIYQDCNDKQMSMLSTDITTSVNCQSASC